MALRSSSSIVTNGLIFYYDMNNPRGYVGPPLTNILPNGINAGYPTSPTGWGTYNTNQYGSGTYFSIGTITGVTNNIVTCPNHLLRTYDVMQPQATGGGVTAGTNYLVRKWDTNTFSLYSYDSTQDSTDIFQTHVNLNTDNRISVSSGITNMWWGYPHLPNSGIMKQTITNGFQYKGRIHDCMRIHWYRPDGVTDGMAYGNEPNITAGQTYTISFYHRAATPNCVGYSASINRWTNGEYTSDSFTVGKNWKKHSYTFTTSQSGSTSFYWFNGNMPAQCAWDLSEIMIYQGSGSSEYVPSNTTRSNNESILDLIGGKTISVSGSPTFNTNSVTFSNTNSAWIEPTTPGDFKMSTSNFTLSTWLKQLDNGTNVILESRGTSLVGYLWTLNYPSSGQISVFLNYGGDQYIYSSSIASLGYGSVQNIVAVVNRSNNEINLYLNGLLWNTITGVHSQNISPSSGELYRIGYDLGGSTQNYELYSYMHYNRALSSSEVLQNFNAQRGIYGV